MPALAGVPLDEAVHFDVVTHDPSTAGEVTATSITFDVFEEATDTAILINQTLTERAGQTGVFRGTFTASAANGFEVGKYYSAVAEATAGGVVGHAVALAFRVVAAETVAGVPEVDITHLAGTVQTAGDIVTLVNDVPTVAEFNARTLVAASYFDATLDAVANVTLVATTTTNTDMVGTTGAALASAYTAARAGYLDNLNISENVAGTSEVGHLVLASGTSDSGTTTTMVDAIRTEATTDHWNDKMIVFGSGGSALNVGHCGLITGFTPGTDTVTFAPAALAAVTTETYTIVPWAKVNLLAATQTSIDAIEIDTNSLNDTKVPNTLNTTALGNIGIDWANVENPTSVNDLAATDIQLVDTVTTYTGNTLQTADHTAGIADIPTVAEFNARTLVAASYFDPAADTVANVTTVATTTTNTDTAATLGTPTDFGSGTSTVAANLQDLADDGTAVYSRTTDSLQAIRDRGDAAWTTGAGGSDRLLMVDTTIATLATQVSFTLSAGSVDDGAYEGCTIVIEDVATATQKAIGIVDVYTGVSKTVTLLEDPGVFLMAATDKVYILAEKGLKPTTSADYHIDVSGTGTVGLDWANIDSKTTTHDFTNTTVGIITTYTGNTVQTGDTYALANGLTGFAAIDTVVDAIKVKTDFLPSVIAGGTGGVFIAGTNAATTVTTSFTTTFTGNLTGSVGSVTGAVGSVTGAVGSVTGHTNQTGDTYALANGLTGFAAIDTVVDAILVDTGTTIPATIVTAQADLDTITGASGVNLLTATQASIDAIETDTGTTIPATIVTAQADLDTITGASGVNLLTATQASIDAIETDTGTTIPATIVTVDTVVDAIKVITDALGATAAANLALSCGAAGLVTFATEAGTLSTTVATTDLTEATDDHYIGRVIVWLTGVLAGQATDITDYAGTAGTLTFTATTEAPGVADTGIIV